MPSHHSTISPAPHRIGCVSFLNSKPLIDPLVGRPGVQIHFAVPSQLMPLVESGAVSTALMSIVDFHLSPQELLLVPAGMIGCDGPTLTVRIFSRVPPEKITLLHGDTDSHTSVMLAQVILRERYHITPTMHPWPPSTFRSSSLSLPESPPESLLLIGDKVVNAAPSAADYPHQLDLGEEWKKLTNLPFVFAMWMMRRSHLNLELAHLLADARRRGADMTDELVARHAAAHRWPLDLARRYFTQYLRYEVTPSARAGLAKFFELAAKLGILQLRRPVQYLELE